KTTLLRGALPARVVAAVAAPHISGSGGCDHKTIAPHLWHVDISVDFFYGGVDVNAFFPSKFTIHSGDRVQFTNRTPSRPQTVTFGPILNTPPLINRADYSEINPAVAKAQGGPVVGDVSQNVYSSGALIS